MLRSLFTLCTLSGVILLSGCKETKSEAWYKQHPDETYAVYTQCLKDGEASDNCEFADLLKAEEQSKGDLLKVFEELGYKISLEP